MLLIFAVYMFGWIPEALSAPITFNTALPVADSQFIFRELVVIGQSGNDPSGAERDRSVQNAISILGYGVNNRLAIFGIIPFVSKELGITVAGQRQNRSASALGDVTLFGRYTVYQDDKPGRTFRIAPFFGLKIPTGEDDKQDNLGRLPASVQPGSGAWDVFGGLVTTYQTLDFQVDGQVSYRSNGEANDIKAGDELRIDGSLQYRLWPKTLSGGVPGFLYGVFEIGFLSKDNNRIGASDDANSGGNSLFLTPGLQYVTKRWIVEAGIQVPVIQDLNGDALESDYIISAGFRFNF